ncbi:hypothetical protein [Granulibacter bethesdensis]|uniref:hypothetical protein n=1 Tax=Granulibacter bethesdensis TaxID=364410 RepID=UPI00046C90F1|nr:hypothetical protein [Granulibacter bethesdensis]
MSYSGWAIIELMGHRQRAGHIEEVEIAGGKMIRIDIPMGDGITEFYATSALYSLRPVSEEIVRDYVRRSGDTRPVRPVEYRDADTRRIANASDDYDEEPDF